MERQGVGLMKKRYGFLIFGFVVSVWALCWYSLVGASWLGIPYSFSDSYLIVGDRGTFGDMFGAVNALFTGLAFAGLICTLFIQIKEFRAQRDELQLTRQAMNDQKEVMEGQQAVMNQQREQITIQNFENGFFQMWRQHFDVIDRLVVSATNRIVHKASSDPKLLHGRVVFAHVRASLVSCILESDGSVSANDQSFIGEKVTTFYRVKGGGVAVYINSLKSIFSYVAKSSVKNKSHYRELILSRFDEDELIVLAFEAVVTIDEDLINILLDNNILNMLDNSIVGNSDFLSETIKRLKEKVA